MLQQLGLPEEFPNGNGHAPRLSGSELLRRLDAYVRRYVVLTDEQADAEKARLQSNAEEEEDTEKGRGATTPRLLEAPIKGATYQVSVTSPP
jgi:hypothetical protein